jgi:hypothetical protein
LISIHHAEVLFALHQPIQKSIMWLKDAAHSSERVVLTLSNQPLGSRHSQDPPPSDTSLIPMYSQSRVLSKPATSLLQNARRSAAEAWNLLGILGENHGSDPKEVLYCYERAMGWAGQHGNKKAEGPVETVNLTESEWRALWTNYVRAREAVNKQG